MSAASGYSGTPLPRKLGLREGARVAFLGAPDDFDAALGELPPGVTVTRRLGGHLDVLVQFVRSRAELERRIAKLREAVFPDGAAWVSWPKRASGVQTDVTEDVVRELALANGLVDVKVVAVDATWSALKLVVRVKDRG